MTKPKPHEDRFDTSKPQFRRHSDRKQKVVLDERFAGVLDDPRFQIAVEDKYGRRRKKKNAVGEELSEFYTIEDPEKKKKSVSKEEASSSSSDEESSAADHGGQDVDEGVDENPASRISYLTALSRGQIELSSSSSEDDSEDASRSDEDSDEDDEEQQDAVVGKAGILDPSNQEDVERTEEPTSILAIMNLDWEHVRAVDIFSILASFTPPGAVRRVRVFPSDFGMERMKAEERFGPADLWTKKEHSKDEATKTADNENEAGDDGSDQDSADDQSGPAQDIASVDSEQELDDVDAFLPKEEDINTGFDPEKLRAYEASKLKYFFAVAEFASAHHADIAYKEVDGLEFEHSSAAVDMRALPADQLEDVIKDRPLRDEALGLPSNYSPPDFVVSALQQTNVQCSWEAGDRDRERTLTKYTSGAQWRDIAESDDLKAYLASDVSSDEDAEDSDNEKAANMRKMLGLDSDDEGEAGGDIPGKVHSAAEESSSDGEGNEDGMAKEVTFVPGQRNNGLEEAIRSKLQSKGDKEELTPWEKYQEKRKQKRRERRQAARGKITDTAETKKQEKDGFFVGEHEDDADESPSKAQSREELELLVAGDDVSEEEKDYDIRELERMEKNKSKKLRGSRKRKESERATAVSGKEFQMDLQDARFKAVLDGDDDRFGIDRTDPKFKETPAMKGLLAEQTKRRRSKKRRKANVAPNVSAESEAPSSGAAALSALVKSIKSKVSNGAKIV